MHPRCAGLAVNQQTVAACVRLAEKDGVHREVRTFATTARELLALAGWLTDHKCTHVAMEATGVNWKPVWQVLQGRFEIVHAGAQQIEQVPGRKPGVGDATWIADLLAHGLIGPRAVPSTATHESRSLTNDRSQLDREWSLETLPPEPTTAGPGIPVTCEDLSDGEDALLAFSAEQKPTAAGRLASVRIPRRAMGIVTTALVGVAAAAGLLLTTRAARSTVAAPRPSNTTAVPSRSRPAEKALLPPPSGRTAFTSQPDHTEVLTARTIPLSGPLYVVSEPHRARVAVDAPARGTTPVSVVRSSGDKTTLRIVNAPQGSEARPAVPSVSGRRTGWLATSTSIRLQVFENGRLLGVTGSQHLELSEGRHDLDFINEALEFRARRTVSVAKNTTTPLDIVVPNGSLSINALPWAEVFIDGRSVGLTPIANLSVPIGPHEILWRHPQMGDMRRTVDVTAQSPTRVGTELIR